MADSIWTAIGTGLQAFAVNGVLLLGSFWIARYGLLQPRGLAAVLATAVVFWTGCTLGLEALGALGAISIGPMLAWGAMFLGVGGVVRWLRVSADRELPTERSSEVLSWDALAGLAAVLWAALLFLMHSLFIAVKVVSDGPIYHLYFAARWWKAGRLILVAAPFGENAATYFPANGDLWFTWLMASWGGDRLARVGQSPFLVLAGLAAFGCARLLGAGRSASVVATCWFVSSTLLLSFSFEPNVDTIFVAGYVVAAYFFLRVSLGEGGTAAVVLGALAAGLALGTKVVAVVFVPPLLALAIAGTWVQSGAARTKIVRTLVIALVPFVSGGYWYIRNGLLTGNPLYPLEVRLRGHTVWHGWYGPEAMRSSQDYLDVMNWRALGDTVFYVLDPRLVPLWIGSLAVAWTIKSPRTLGKRSWIAVFSLMAVLNVAIYWVLIPYRTQARFMLHALGMAAVPLAVTLDRAQWLRRLAVLLLVLHVLTPQNWPFPARADAIPWNLSPVVPSVISPPLPLALRVEQIFRDDESTNVGASAIPGGRAVDVDVSLAKLATKSRTRKDRTGVGNKPGSAQRRSLWGLTFWSNPLVVSAGLICGIGLASALLVWTWSRDCAGSTRFVNGIYSLAALALFVLLGYSQIWYEGLSAQFKFYPLFPDFLNGWNNFDARSGPAGTRVAYAGTNLPYYLLGNGLRNDVRYVNIDRHRDWLLHDYHREARLLGRGNWENHRPGWDRIQPDFQAWIDNLEAEGIQLLVVTRVNPREGSHNVADLQQFPIERYWADSHPERFEPLYGVAERDPWFRLYRFRRSRSDPPHHGDSSVKSGLHNQIRAASTDFVTRSH